MVHNEEGRRGVWNHIFILNEMTMKRIIFLSCLVSAFECTLFSCMSPLDPETPRKRIEDPGFINPSAKPGRIYAKSFTLTVQEASTQWQHTIVDTLVQIDTSVSPPAVWLKMYLSKSGQIPKKLPFLQQLKVRKDSIKADDSFINIFEDTIPPPGGGPYAIYSIGATKDSAGAIQYVVINSDRIQQTALTTITFHYNESLKELRGQLKANLIAYRLLIDAQIVITY